MVYGAAPKLEKPDWLELTEVSKRMDVVGVPSTVYMFSGAYKLEDILSFYRKKWQTVKKSSVKEKYVEPWHILSSLRGEYLYTLQVKPENGLMVGGYLSFAHVRGAGKKKLVKESVPALAGSRTVNDYTMQDPGKKGRVVLLTNSQSVTVNHDYYSNYYTNKGWQTDVSQKTQDSSVQVFRTRGKESHVVISRQYGKTQVVINLVEN